MIKIVNVNVSLVSVKLELDQASQVNETKKVALSKYFIRQDLVTNLTEPNVSI